MTPAPGRPYSYESPASCSTIAVLVIANAVLDILAFSLVHNRLSICLPDVASCSDLLSAWSGLAIGAAVVAAILTARIVRWYVRGAFRLMIMDGQVTLIGRRSALAFPTAAISRCHINVVTDTAALRFNRNNVRDFRNWAKDSPEYSGSAVDFHLERGGGETVFSFPLELRFAGASAVAASLPGIPLTITTNAQPQAK